MVCAMSERDVYDITIIGAGPTGLFAAFYAGMRQARTQVIDSLEEPGGALAAIYPEKFIYDVAGFPKILAKDLVANLVEQADRFQPDIRLREEVTGLELLEDGILKLTTTVTERYSRAVIIAAGVGAFEPKKLDAPGLIELEGKGVHYFAKRIETFRDRDVVIVGGGDSAVDWALTLEPIAKRVTLIHRSKFRAHESTIRELEESSVDLRFPGHQVVEVHAGDDGLLNGVSFKNAEDEVFKIPADDLIVAIGFLADLGPLKTWGLEMTEKKREILSTTSRCRRAFPACLALATSSTIRPSSS
jgi:thioredoxin reductase